MSPFDSLARSITLHSRNMHSDGTKTLRFLPTLAVPKPKLYHHHHVALPFSAPGPSSSASKLVIWGDRAVFGVRSSYKFPFSLSCRPDIHGLAQALQRRYTSSTRPPGNQIHMGDDITPAEEFPFPLTDVDKWVLSQTDEEFACHTWDELRELIRTDIAHSMLPPRPSHRDIYGSD
jgi:hypothetical protein